MVFLKKLCSCTRSRKSNHKYCRYSICSSPWGICRQEEYLDCEGTLDGSGQSRWILAKNARDLLEMKDREDIEKMLEE